jgi:arsenate reductase-like glutaredoxin family protein
VKAQGFLEQSAATVKEVVDAKIVRIGREEALALAKKAKTVVAGRGKNVVTIDMKQPPPDDELADLILGPSGNLKAPTILVDKTLVVGFNEEAYKRFLG